MPSDKPVIHGRDHLPGHADPIPGLILGPTTLSEIILSHDPSGFWKLNEDSGDIAHDSADGYDLSSGAFSPPTWAQPAGPPGEQTAEFGANLGELLTSFPSLSGDLTLEIWGYRASTEGHWLIGQGTPDVSNHAGVSLQFETDVFGLHNRLVVFIGDTTGGPHMIQGDNVLPTGAWYYCAVTRASGVWTLYVEGAAQATTYDDSGTNYSAASGIWLGGADPSVPGGACPGRLSYAAAYDHALTAGEIADHYLAGTSGVDPTATQVLLGGAGNEPHWGQVPTDALEDAAVTTEKIADGTIVNADVATGANLDPLKIQHPGGTSSFLRADGTWATPAAGSVATDALWDTKGDIAAATGADAADNLPVGSNGQVLTADSTQTMGVKWATPSTGSPSADTQVWMPLTTTVGSDDVLVFDANHQLIPTLTAI